MYRRNKKYEDDVVAQRAAERERRRKSDRDRFGAIAPGGFLDCFGKSARRATWWRAVGDASSWSLVFAKTRGPRVAALETRAATPDGRRRPAAPLRRRTRRVELAPVAAADAVGEDDAALAFHPGTQSCA